MKIFETVAALKLAKLRADQLVETKSYYGSSATDTTGAARYKIVTAAEFGSTPDGYGDHTIANGNIAQLINVLDTNSSAEYGGLGDNSTNNSASNAAISAASLNEQLIYPFGTYLTSTEQTYDKVKITGQLFPTLKSSVTNGSLGTLKNNVILENIVIDGNNSTSRQFLVGDTSAGLTENIWINQNLAQDAPSNCFRLTAYGAKTVISDNQSENCKLFNTDDQWQGSNLIVYSNIIDDVSGEGGLFESPAFDAVWHGTQHFGNIYQMAAGGKRPIGYAGIKGFVDSGNIFRGNTAVTKDVFHYEDDCKYGTITGSLIVANGAPAAVDCALGGDPTYVWYTSASGTFTNGETILGGISGVTATVVQTLTGNILKVSSPSGTFRGDETITGGTSGVTATVVRREPKSILFSSHTIIADNAKGVEMDGSEPLEFQKNTLSNLHIENSTVPVRYRGRESAIINNVMYDAQAPTIVIKSDSPDAQASSPTGHTVLVTDNHYINPTFIRGNVGLCFDPNNLLFRYSFANEGTPLTFGGSVGTGGTETYPVSVAGDGIAGVKYYRATKGTTAFTRRIDLDYSTLTNDIQNGDTISIQIMCRSSVANRGRVQIAFPSAGPSLSQYNLTTTTDWQVLGVSKNIPSTANLFVSGTVEIDIFTGENMTTNGETFDIAWIKVSHVRGY